jgi:hypothetical protein
LLLFVADRKRFGRVLVLSSHFVVSWAGDALNVVDEREMRSLGKATRTLFVANPHDASVGELFALFVVFDVLLVVVVVVVVVGGGVETIVLVNLRLFALEGTTFVSSMKLESYLFDNFLNRVLRLPTFSAMMLLFAFTLLQLKKIKQTNTSQF